MTGHVLVLALVTTALLHVATCMQRAKVNEIRLNDLTDKLEEYKTKVLEKTGTLPERRRQLHELKARVNELEDQGCGKREVRCKTKSRKCISDLMVCDGVKECEDGSDESNCENPVKAGVTLVGDTYNVNCQRKVTPQHIQLDIVGEKRVNYFSTVAELRVNSKITYADGNTAKKTYDGVYYFGKKTLVVNAEEGESLALVCHFATDTSNFCHAEFKSISSERSCGEAILVVQE